MVIIRIAVILVIVLVIVMVIPIERIIGIQMLMVGDGP